MDGVALLIPGISQGEADGRYVRRVGEQVTGVNAFAPPTTIDAPRGTGYSVPSGFLFRVPTMRTAPGEDAVPQAYAEALRVQEVANASGREVALWNPSGPVMGGIPAGTATALLIPGVGGRFVSVVQVLRASSQGTLQLARVNGSLDSPAALGSAETFGQFSLGGYDGSALVTATLVQGRTREIWSGTNRGSALRFSAVDVGSATVKGLFDFQGGGSGIAEIASLQPTFRLIPGATGIAERNNLNTADTRFLSADGSIFTLPLVSRLSLPSLPTSAAGLAAGEVWVDTGAGNVLKRV